MLELIHQLDGFDFRGSSEELMTIYRPDTGDPSLMKPGRLQRN
jgi:ATP-dependent 26S proteasome regulatory subunit